MHSLKQEAPPFMAVECHPDHSPKLAQDPDWQSSLKTGKPLWGSEIGWQPYDTGAANLAKNYNQGYIAGRMTAYINWATI